MDTKDMGRMGKNVIRCFCFTPTEKKHFEYVKGIITVVAVLECNMSPAAFMTCLLHLFFFSLKNENQLLFGGDFQRNEWSSFPSRWRLNLPVGTQ